MNHTEMPQTKDDRVYGLPAIGGWILLMALLSLPVLAVIWFLRAPWFVY